MALPESELIEGEVLLRDMRLTTDARMTKKSLIRWIALSLGLISPRESRRTILDLLEALFYYQLKKKKDPDVSEIMDYISKKLGGDGGNEKAVRYHLLQLKNSGLIARKKGKYFFTVSPLGEKGDLPATVDFVYKKRAEQSISKTKQALKELSDLYS